MSAASPGTMRAGHRLALCGSRCCSAKDQAEQAPGRGTSFAERGTGGRRSGGHGAEGRPARHARHSRGLWRLRDLCAAAGRAPGAARASGHRVCRGRSAGLARHMVRRGAHQACAASALGGGIGHRLRQPLPARCAPGLRPAVHRLGYGAARLLVEPRILGQKVLASTSMAWVGPQQMGTPGAGLCAPWSGRVVACPTRVLRMRQPQDHPRPVCPPPPRGAPLQLPPTAPSARRCLPGTRTHLSRWNLQTVSSSCSACRASSPRHACARNPRDLVEGAPAWGGDPGHWWSSAMSVP